MAIQIFTILRVIFLQLIMVSSYPYKDKKYVGSNWAATYISTTIVSSDVDMDNCGLWHADEEVVVVDDDWSNVDSDEPQHEVSAAIIVWWLGNPDETTEFSICKTDYCEII